MLLIESDKSRGFCGKIGCVGQIFTWVAWVTWVKIFFAWIIIFRWFAWVKIFAWVNFFLRRSKFFVGVEIFA